MIKSKNKRIIFKVFIIFLIVIISFNLKITAKTEATTSDKNLKNLNSLITTLDGYSNELIDVRELKNDLISGKQINYTNIILRLKNVLFKEITNSLKGSVLILIILILISVIKSLELEPKSGINNVAKLVCFLVIASICTTGYIELLGVFKHTVKILCEIISIISPFILTMLIATGTITTSSIIGPIILFLSSLVGLIINYIVIPITSISLILRIISAMSDEAIKFEKFSKFLSGSAMWIFSIMFAIILGAISMLSSVSTSVDEVAVKTTKAVVSAIPVVGKFVADSTEAVMSATELIGKTSGVIGIVVLFTVSIIPIVKLEITYFTYNLIAATSEMINADERSIKLIEDFATHYKILIGMLFGVITVFTISLGIIISLLGKVVA